MSWGCLQFVISLAYSLTILNYSHNLEGFGVIRSLGGDDTKGTGVLVYNVYVYVSLVYS